jgi:hypothetical protein
LKEGLLPVLFAVFLVKLASSPLQGLPAKSSSDIGIFSLVTVFLALA